MQTREDDDFSIALLDAWATVADVLMFYQERVANESYMRTATERFSLIELARLIGYQARYDVVTVAGSMDVCLSKARLPKPVAAPRN